MGSSGAACAGEKSLPQLLIKSRLLQVLNRSVGKAVQMSTLILSRQEKKNNNKKKSAGVAGTSNSNSLSQPGWEELGVWAHSPGPAGWHRGDDMKIPLDFPSAGTQTVFPIVCVLK